MKIESLITLSNGIIPWLNATKGDVKEVGTNVFKRYRPLDRGNVKLNTSILSFSLLPVVTCKSLCKGCYDVKSLRHTSVRKKRYVNTSLAIHNLSTLEALIIKQIKNSRTCKFVRIHVGGDFFASDYVKMWTRITSEIGKVKPSIKFYTYTKTEYTSELQGCGINVVQSDYKEEGFNYGDLESMKVLAKKYAGIVCPATTGKVSNGFCGSVCKACMRIENVFFGIH